MNGDQKFSLNNWEKWKKILISFNHITLPFNKYRFKNIIMQKCFFFRKNMCRILFDISLENIQNDYFINEIVKSWFQKHDFKKYDFKNMISKNMFSKIWFQKYSKIFPHTFFIYCCSILCQKMTNFLSIYFLAICEHSIFYWTKLKFVFVIDISWRCLKGFIV